MKFNVYNVDNKIWDNAVNEVIKALEDKAKEQRNVFYSDLAPSLKTIRIEAYSPIFWSLLGNASYESYRNKGVLLSSIVINKKDGRPGKQFYQFCKDYLGKRFNSEEECWANEVSMVFKKYGSG